ncbi:DUF2807 domain-containing protein [Massilia forsythiae]|uniref:DUF2807 domain-containing protein n=1 Tax=Massilia forsythiae TaxID=2728020 RepID=A0A7Z2VYC9_9BURK|nr:DUF2807 domain-containing protein [Massilia forsythiae]QJE01335.1 DUF2807 domain-containing protein [Massilia forsythiae]
MNKMVTLGMAQLGLWAALGIAQAAPEPDTQVRVVDARVVRVRLDGAVDLRIRQGGTPSLTLSGDPRWVARTTTEQRGDTLRIDSEMQGRMRLGSLHAELILPALREVVSESLGATEVTGFSGDDLALTLDGAGSMRVSASYRTVSANLGGIGSMQLQGLDSEVVSLSLQGAGFVMLSGRTRLLKADLAGLGNLDAQQFSADSVDVDLSGLGNASVTAHRNANLNLSGLGSVTVYGKPLNRKVALDGLGKVSWK